MATKKYTEPRKGEKKYKLIKDRIDSTLRYMQSRVYNGHVDWARYMRLYRGLQWSSSVGRQRNPSSDAPNETIVFNEVGTIIQQVMPYVLAKLPKIKCKPTRTEFVISAMLQEIVGNYAWKEYKYQEATEQAVLDFFTCGNMFMGHSYKFEVDETKKNTGNITYEDFVKVDAPSGRRISPFLMIVDQNAPNHLFDSARWVCEIQFESPGDILGNLKYNRQDVIDDIGNGRWKPGSVESLIKSSATGVAWEDQFEGEDERWVKLNYWDKKFDEHIILIPNVPFPIHEEENPYKGVLEGHPYTHQKLIAVPNDMFGIGIPAWIEDPQYELNRHATKVFAHRREHSGGQYIYDSSLDPKDIAAHKRGESIVSPNPAAVTPCPVADIPRDDYAALDLIRQAIRDYSRWSEFARTGALQDRASATQSNIVQGNLTVGVDFIKGLVDRFTINNCRILIQLIKGFWSGERVVQIAGPMGEYWGMMSNNPPGPDGKYWVQYTAEDIQGEFEVDIESTAAESYDPTTEKSQRMALLQTAAQLKPYMDAEGSKLSISEMFKWVLEAFPDKDTGRFFPITNIKPAPMQTVTAMQAQGGGGQQPALGAPPPGVPPRQQQVQQSAATPESAMLGKLFGGLTTL